jgi:hypothetical protein
MISRGGNPLDIIKLKGPNPKRGPRGLRGMARSHGPSLQYRSLEPHARRSPPMPIRGLQAPAQDNDRTRARPRQRNPVEQVARPCTTRSHPIWPPPPVVDPTAIGGPAIGPKGGPLPEVWRIDPSCAEGAHGKCAHCTKDPDGQSAHS